MNPFVIEDWLGQWRQGLDAIALRCGLQQWYGEQGRSLPWRECRDPYAIWVAEIMLQQTQVRTVIPYYTRWLTTFPTVKDLAIADQQTVLKQWAGLGYYARGRNLHKAAQVICTTYGGHLPQQYEALVQLPGIGRTTAGGILSAAFNLPVAILDGNVKRVLARLTGLPIPPQGAIASLWELSEFLLDRDRPRDFNQAIMDLGATVCTPKNPTCHRCPWQPHCIAHRHHQQHTLPMRTPTAPLPLKNIGVAVIQNDRGQILIDRRLETGLLGGLWEFPGGKIEPDETVEACIVREIQEELDITIAVGAHLITIDHAYTHFRVRLHVHHCTHLSGEPRPLESQEIRWVTLDEIDEYPFPKANTTIIAALKQQAATPQATPKNLDSQVN